MTGETVPAARSGADYAPLVASLRAVTNSYKHLFLRALLRLSPRARDGRIGFEALFRGMLEEAWWPAFHYRLHLGLQDRVVARLDAEIAAPDVLRRDTRTVKDAVAAIDFDLQRERERGLLRYVPQRLLVPWFEAELRGVSDGRRDALIADLSDTLFGDRRPLYRIETEGVVLHPVWRAALAEDHAILAGWSDALWIRFLEARNPAVPGLAEKIDPAIERRPLTPERALWREVLARDPIPCVYTGVPLDPEAFALDHFLPRAFVAHDRLWNLTPVDPALNSAKVDHLPHERFIEPLAHQHARFAATARDLGGRAATTWRRGLSEIAVDLRIEEATVTEPDRLAEVYHETVGSLAGVARRLGFRPGWMP